MMTESKTDVFWLSEPGLTRMIFVGPAYEEIWGRSRQSLYQSPGSHLDAIHPEDRERVMAALAETSRDTWELQYRIVRPDIFGNMFSAAWAARWRSSSNRVTRSRNIV